MIKVENILDSISRLYKNTNEVYGLEISIHLGEPIFYVTVYGEVIEDFKKIDDAMEYINNLDNTSNLVWSNNSYCIGSSKMVMKCTCKHEYQDKKYGKGNRVHNNVNKGKAGAKCTVCGSEKYAVWST